MVLLSAWRAPWVSYPVIYNVVGVIIGVLAVALAPSVLASTQPDHTSGGMTLFICGLGLVAQCGFCMIAPAWRVEELEGGHFIFHARRRALRVAPGAVRSVRCVWIDPNRLLPMRLRSISGGILIAPRMRDVEGLYKALAEANPEANITSPLGPMSRWPWV